MNRAAFDLFVEGGDYRHEWHRCEPTDEALCKALMQAARECKEQMEARE